MNSCLNLVPAIYSKGKTVDEILVHITSYPEQDANTVEAIDHTLEFQVDGLAPVATLAELHRAFPEVVDFVIHPRAGGGVIAFKYMDGKFIHEETVPA